MGISHIVIEERDQHGHVVGKLLLGTGGDPALKAGDTVDVAFPDNSSPSRFKLIWRKMWVAEIENYHKIYVTDEEAEYAVLIDGSCIRR